jgi:DNA helicase TIP49 (TBP-interacting protein)
VQGDVHKKKEVVQDVTLHDLDAANARPQVLGRTPSWLRASPVASHAVLPFGCSDSKGT